ncbi:hypothetical protein N9948_00980 [bacterium]|nr:hypothetical protein [bacterium]
MEDFEKYHGNLRSLVDTLLEIVPEAHDKRDEIFALIKTYVHGEKHFLWNDLKHWINKKDRAYERIILPKIETHKKDAWGNYEKNLEWVKKYQAMPNTIKFIKGRDHGQPKS